MERLLAVRWCVLQLVQSHIHTSTLTHIHIYIHMHTNTHTHTHTRTHTYTVLMYYTHPTHTWGVTNRNMLRWKVSGGASSSSRGAYSCREWSMAQAVGVAPGNTVMTLHSAQHVLHLLPFCAAKATRVHKRCAAVCAHEAHTAGLPSASAGHSVAAAPHSCINHEPEASTWHRHDHTNMAQRACSKKFRIWPEALHVSCSFVGRFTGSSQACNACVCVSCVHDSTCVCLQDALACCGVRVCGRACSASCMGRNPDASTLTGLPPILLGNRWRRRSVALRGASANPSMYCRRAQRKSSMIQCGGRRTKTGTDYRAACTPQGPHHRTLQKTPPPRQGVPAAAAALQWLAFDTCGYNWYAPGLSLSIASIRPSPPPPHCPIHQNAPK